jgi:hypothetical protein
VNKEMEESDSSDLYQYYCTECGGFIVHEDKICPHCGADTSHFIEQEDDVFQEEDPDFERVMARKQTLGLIGSLVLFVGVFTPIISLPFVGSMNYFQNGRGDGVIILALAIVSLILTLTKRYGGLWFTGLGSLAIMIFTFINFQTRMSEAKAQMETQLSGNPFRGIADIAMQSVQIQWGWAVLIVGAGLVIAAASIKTPYFDDAA